MSYCHLYLKGEQFSQIRWNPANKTWTWTDKRHPGEYAVISKTYSSLLMGRATANFDNMQVSAFDMFYKISKTF